MASIRSALVVVVAVAGLMLSQAAQAGMAPPGTLFLEGPISSLDIKAGQLSVAGRTLQLTAETVIERQAGKRHERLAPTQLYLGLPIRAIARSGPGGVVVRSIEVFEGGIRHLGK